MSYVCCPKCRNQLETSNLSIVNKCSNCGNPFRYQNGIIDFTPDNKFYWGEINECLMKKINDIAENEDWFTTLKEQLQGRDRRLLNYILDPVRYAGLFHFYDENMTGACLDLGSGWGPISFGLSRFFNQVYSVDGVFERLRFQSIRAAQSNVNNITFLRSTLFQLPIPDESIDAVIVNGLLEWVGLSESSVSPSILQERFLNEIQRVLKPKGHIMIGIENRFGLLYLLGGRDHSGLRFTSIIPRKLANIVVKNSKRGEDALIFSGAENSYRTLTYSYWGYKKLLEKTGYKDTEIYWAWPGYNFPRASGTIEGKSVKYYINQAVNLTDNPISRYTLSLIRMMPSPILGSLIKIFSPYFLIVSHKNQKGCKFQEKIVQSSGEEKSFIRTTLGTRTDFKTTYQLLSNAQLSHVVGITEKPDSSLSSFAYHKQSGIRGRLVRPYLAKDLEMVGSWLSSYQKQNTTGNWSKEDLVSELERLIEPIVSNFGENNDLKVLLSAYQENYNKEMTSLTVPVVAEHGDFTPPNILINYLNEVKVIDWEHSLSGGNPLMDLGGFYLSLIRRNSRHKNNEFLLSKNQKPIHIFIQSFLSNSETLVPVDLSPAYYLLRVIKREMENNKVTPNNYLYLQGWLEFLPAAIRFSKRTM